MLDVMTQLHRYADAAEAAVPEHGPGTKDPRRSRTALLAAAAAVLVVGAAATVVILRRDEHHAPVRTGSDQTVEPELWETLPPPPIGPFTADSVTYVATDTELIVLGVDSGAAFSFADRTWRPITPSPLTTRSGPVSTWTGREMLVWGGETTTGTATDGAAYDPETDTWRMLPTAGVAARKATTGTAWTGKEWVLGGIEGQPPNGETTDTVALDPESGVWRSLPPSPLGSQMTAQQIPRRVAAVWTDREVLVASISDALPVAVDRLRLDDGAASWGSAVGIAVDGPETDPSGVVWTGDHLLVLDRSGRGIAFDSSGEVDPNTNNSTLIPPSAAQPGQSWLGPVVVGHIVTVGGRWLDLRDLTWHDALPDPGPPRASPIAVAHDGLVYVFGGDACGDIAGCPAPVDPGNGLVWTPPG